MNVNAVGEGRRGSISESVGKLTLSGAKGCEAKMLKILWREIRDGNLGYWAALMWLAQEA